MPMDGYTGPRRDCRVRFLREVGGVPAGTECAATFFEYYNGTINGRVVANLTPHYVAYAPGRKMQLAAIGDCEEVVES